MTYDTAEISGGAVRLPIRGAKWRNTTDIVHNAVMTGEAVALEPDPANPVARNAVKIMLRGEHVAFVPAEAAADVRRWIAGDRILSVRTAPPWHITITLGGPR